MQTTTVTTNVLPKNKVELSEVRKGDVFSEESHYVYQGSTVGKNNKGENVTTHQLKHLESNQIVNLDDRYVSELLQSADQHQTTVNVGREDKYWTAKQIADSKKKGDLAADTEVREGDVKLQGIRSIWSSINSGKVFFVSFNKQGKDLTAKALKEARNKQLQVAIADISTAATTNGDVVKIAEEAIKKIQEAPVLPSQPGEERKLRGYKVQFVSSNGFYDVVDMDIENTGKNENLRKVNINEINWLVVDGVKYVVE